MKKFFLANHSERKHGKCDEAEAFHLKENPSKSLEFSFVLEEITLKKLVFSSKTIKK